MNEPNPRGWRRYGLVVRPEGYFLKGMWISHWPTSELRAECGLKYAAAPFDLSTVIEMDPAAQCREHLLAHPDDSLAVHHAACGIYVVRDRAKLRNVVGTHGQFDAGVIAWGAVAQYEYGWRAEFVRIEYLELTHPLPWRSHDLFGSAADEIDPRVLQEVALAEIEKRYGIPIKVPVAA